jgi:hypothetical protein
MKKIETKDAIFLWSTQRTKLNEKETSRSNTLYKLKTAIKSLETVDDHFKIGKVKIKHYLSPLRRRICHAISSIENDIPFKNTLKWLSLMNSKDNKKFKDIDQLLVLIELHYTQIVNIMNAWDETLLKGFAFCGISLPITSSPPANDSGCSITFLNITKEDDEKLRYVMKSMHFEVDGCRGNIRLSIAISTPCSIGYDYLYETEGEFLPKGIDRSSITERKAVQYMIENSHDLLTLRPELEASINDFLR